jgi:hypothetical protein
MSEEKGDIGRDRTHCFRSRMRQDRHIQNIIDYTSDLSAIQDGTASHLTLPDGGEGSSRPGHSQIDNDQLADFGELPSLYWHNPTKALPDRQLLNRPLASSRGISSISDPPRASLSARSVSNVGIPRIIGDASHHFRPFIPRSVESRTSQFITNAIRLDQQSTSLASSTAFGRDGSRRLLETQRGSQVATPPLNAG